MKVFRRILCPIDFSEYSQKALRCALSIAKHYGANLRALHVVELWRHPSAFYAPSPALSEWLVQLRAKGNEKLLEFVRAQNLTACDVESAVVEGIAPDAILAAAHENEADLIVMGTHGRRGFDRLMIGSVAERVIRYANCPVLTVRVEPSGNASHGDHEETTRPKQFLYCTDFSESSLSALNCALSLTRQYDAALTLLNVVEENAGTSDLNEALKRSEEELDRLVPVEWLGARKVRLAVRAGKPYLQIAQLAAELRADLAVMAVRNRSATDLSVFGSTTHRMIQLGPCPVLVVRA